MNSRPPTRDPAGPVSLGEAGRALRAGAAVVFPNPAPLTHVVAALRARTVNEAKGRPAGQPVALWAHHPDTVQQLDGIWGLEPGPAATARRLLVERLLTLLVPVRDPAELPGWTQPAVKDGWMLMFGARWRPLRPLLDEHPVLYVSSANRTGRAPAAGTADALAMFPAAVPVLAVPPSGPTAGAEQSASGPRMATTTVRMHPDGRLELHRHGAQDRDFADAEGYLEHLRRSAR